MLSVMFAVALLGCKPSWIIWWLLLKHLLVNIFFSPQQSYLCA